MPAPITEPQFTDDGRRLHTFRQSSMKTLDICSERSRLEMSGLMPKRDTDAATMGTSVHLGIELILCELRDTGEPLPVSAAIEAAQQEFSELMLGEHFAWVQVKEGAARKFIERAIRLFHAELLPRLDPLHMEYGFGPITLWEDEHRVIVVTGTIDYVDGLFGLGDWKTGNRKYEQWEYQRWGIQPSVYTWAAVHEGLVTPDSDGLVPFKFFVFLKKQDVEIQEVTVYRHEGDWAWLKEKALETALLIEAELPSWPKNDNHALCSPTWCPAWDMCKGKHYAPEWPKPSRPR